MVDRHIFQRLGAKLFLCAVMVAAADWLFYGQPLGWTVGLYGGLVLGLLLLTQRSLLQSAFVKGVFIMALSLVAQMIEAPDTLPVTVYTFCLATLLILKKREEITDSWLLVQDITSFILRILRQWHLDYGRISKLRKLKGVKIYRILRYAVLPMALTFTFIYLFTQANPIIANIMQAIDFSFFTSPQRWLFWIASAMALWGILRPRFPLAAKKAGFALIEDINFDLWLNKNSIVISLAVFNILFALQNGLDAAFLWRGEKLPNGMSYATYAHAGAYPLIFTAILAAVYVLITFGENSGRYQSPLARAGVYVWVAQNIFLVISAMSRNIHYIESYSLTYLRVAALIWMGLVAVGLFLIVLRIYADKSNLWLLNANALTLAAVLYVCCFPNFDRLIADYNVSHAREVTRDSAGSNIDLDYMKELGPEALPALSLFQVKAGPDRRVSWLERDLLSGMNGNWRAWTWRKQRLIEELNIH